MSIFDELDAFVREERTTNTQVQEERDGLITRWNTAVSNASTGELLEVLKDASQVNVELFDADDARVVRLQADASVLDGVQKKRGEFGQQLGEFLNRTQQPNAQGDYGLSFAEMTAALTDLQKSAKALRPQLDQITLTESGGLKAIWRHEDDCLEQSLRQRDMRWSELAAALAEQTQQALQSQNTDRAGELIRTLAEWKDMPDHPYDVALAAERAQGDYLQSWENQVQERQQAAAALRARADRDGLIIERCIALLGEAHEKLLEAQGLKADVIAPEIVAITQKTLQEEIETLNQSIEGVQGKLWASVGARLAILRQADLGKLVQDWKAAEAPEGKRENLALFHKAFVGTDLPPDFLKGYAEWLDERTTFRRAVEDALKKASENFVPEHIADMDALSVHVKQVWQRLETTEAPDANEVAALQAFEQQLSARVAEHAEQVMVKVNAVLDQEVLTQDRLDVQQTVLKTEVTPLKSLSVKQCQTLRALRESIAERVPPDPAIEQILTYLNDLITAANLRQLRFSPTKDKILRDLEERRFKGDYSSVRPKQKHALKDKMEALCAVIDTTDCAKELEEGFPAWLLGRIERLAWELRAETPAAAVPTPPVAESQSVQEPAQADSAVSNDEAAQ